MATICVANDSIISQRRTGGDNSEFTGDVRVAFIWITRDVTVIGL